MKLFEIPNMYLRIQSKMVAIEGLLGPNFQIIANTVKSTFSTDFIQTKSTTSTSTFAGTFFLP